MAGIFTGAGTGPTPTPPEKTTPSLLSDTGQRDDTDTDTGQRDGICLKNEHGGGGVNCLKKRH